MKNISPFTAILLGCAIAVILACAGSTPYVPSIHGGTTGGVGSFGLAIQPPQNTIYANAQQATKVGRGITFNRSTQFSVIIDFAGGWNHSVALSADTPQVGWMDVSLDKSSVPATSGNQTATLTCTLNNNWDSEFQNVTVPVHATSNGTTITKNATVVVSNADYSVTLTPAQQNINEFGQPDSADITVTVTPSGGFAGPVSLSVGNPDTSMFSTSIDSSSLTVSGTTPQTTTLHVQRISTASSGDFVFTVTGNGHNIVHSGSATVTVINNDKR